MGKLAILLPLDSDDAALSGGDWAIDLALLQDMQPTRSVRSTDAANASTIIVIHATAAKAWSGLALGRTNLSADALVRISGADAEGDLGSTGYVGDWISAWPTSGRPEDRGLVWRDVFKTWTPGDSYAWWRIEIDDDTNADGYVEIGRLYIDALWQPAYNYSYGWERGRASVDIRVDTPGGHTLTDKRAAGPRVWSLPLNFVDRDDADDFLDEIDRLMGTAKDLFACLDPNETIRLHRKMMMATMPEVPPRSQPLFEIFRTTLKLKELR